MNLPTQPLATLLQGMTDATLAGDCAVSSLSLDSRTVRHGGLFLACRGGQRHALEFLPQVLEQGVAAVAYEPDERWPAARLQGLLAGRTTPLVPVEGLRGLASVIAGRFYGDPTHRLRMIGITGTNGKTSCSHFLAQALAPETSCGIIGTLGNGLPGALQTGGHTTPDPVEVQSLCADLLSRGARAVAMEVSSHALDQGRVAAVRFDTAVLTNLSHDHLDYHGDMAAYAAAKQRLFQSSGLRCAVINLDDPFGIRLLEAVPPSVRVIGYSLDAARPLPAGVADWLVATEVAPQPKGLTLKFAGSFGAGEFSVPLLGRFNAANLLAVAAVLLEQGMAPVEVAARLAALGRVDGRMEPVFPADAGVAGERPLVVVDYAHTPDALEQVLSALREHTRGRLWCLFGCGGDRDRSKRPKMGAIAERLADQVVVTDDNPRSEDGRQIVQAILAGMSAPGRVWVERDRRLAIQWTVTAAKAGDVVLVAGKGHERTQQIGDTKIPFCDRDEVLQALRREAA